MKKRLFLICPDCQLDCYLGSKYKNAFSFTALGAVFNLTEKLFAEELIDFVEREAITEITVVNDVGCGFISNVLSKQGSCSTFAEEVLVDLLIDNHSEVMDQETPALQQEKLAELNVRRQLKELLDIDYFKQRIALQSIKLQGYVTAKHQDRMVEVKLLNPRCSA